ncbi:hypothetical protein QE612_06920 [Streptococcus suis]|uniref:hypothetical protein n=1 Tax=Bacteria TaxID=2 RepID=UPI000A91A144|nr:hypothetical protein [Streptococcus suis]MDD7409849.1 hypothetical protein [Fusobacteriaceae bacterium]MDY5713029.1 hypothetical protein [Fusobacterium gastrosuis]MBS8094492.1 hypothetical protein [Streptococcus suis]MBY4977217.1 hypothetical protein [Streptococcus suis]MCB2853401.1 hypothetical protein [Streptococcus suis]
MKKFRDIKNKNEIYIGFIYLLVACAVLANFSQLIVLKYKFGNFNFGEMIIVMFNDSYTGYFTFPFLLGFILMLQSPVEQNIYFTLTRFSSRYKFYKNKHLKVIRTVISYIFSICIFSLITGIGNADFGLRISMATQKFSEIYLLGNFESDFLILEILKIVILQSLLLYFFALLHAFLTQFRISQSIVFVIYTGILIFMAGITLGFFGELIKPFSLFSIAGSVYGHGIGFIPRVVMLILIDTFLLVLNFKIFGNKDIMLPKGSKQYQNE